MIDLHLHTTASDGQSTPDELVRQAHRAGIRTLSVTDHDTLAATDEVAACAAALEIDTVVGIEITAVHEERDVHMLGYFLETDSTEFGGFLQQQRDDRVRRVEEMGDRLATLGFPIDVRGLVERARLNRGRFVGRPQVARALVRAGHAGSVQESFDKFLAIGRPAFVPRRGASPAQVIRLIRRAGGIASLAHPGLLGRDELIPGMVQAGLGAIEVFHSQHDEPTRHHYRTIAESRGLATSGGSDFHGVSAGRENHLGRVALPPAEFEALRARANADRLAGAPDTPAGV